MVGKRKLSFAPSMMMVHQRCFRAGEGDIEKEDLFDVALFFKRLSFAPSKMVASTPGLRRC